MSRILVFWLLISTWLIPVAGAIQPQKPAITNDSDLGVRHDHAAWPSPESLTKDLHSNDEAVRLKALHLLGLSDEQAYEAVWTDHSPEPRIVGKKVIFPDVVDLRYAALGEGDAQQAIVAMQTGPMIYAAIANPAAKGWERIATFNCWCKYEIYGGVPDALNEVVRLSPVPLLRPPNTQHFELVLLNSGGGTGIYWQDEGHYRVHKDELRSVISFVSRHRNCDPTGPAPHICNLERRWFYTTAVDGIHGGVLVEGRVDFASDTIPQVENSVRELEDRPLKTISCRTYKWDAQTFRYEPFKSTNPCSAPKPAS